MTAREFVKFEFLSRQPLFTPVEALHTAHQLATDRAVKCPHGIVIFNHCGHLIACNYGFSHLGVLTASGAWKGMPKKYKRPGLDKMLKAPAGALLFWTGGSDGDGHTGIADGLGNILANDLPDTNVFGRFPVAEVTNRFTQLIPAGWAFPFFELATRDDRDPPGVAGQPSRTVRLLDELIAAEHDAIAAAKKAILALPSPGDDAMLQRIVAESREHINVAKSLQQA